MSEKRIYMGYNLEFAEVDLLRVMWHTRRKWLFHPVWYLRLVAFAWKTRHEQGPVVLPDHLLLRHKEHRAFRAERWLTSLSFWIPRRHREAIVGDLREDCAELRNLGMSERRLRVHVIWQLAICLFRLWPPALKAAILGALGALVRKLL